MLARAALWLLGADRYGDRYWQRLREEMADAPLRADDIPAGGTVASAAEVPRQQTAPAPVIARPRAWLAPRSGWLR